MGVGSHIPASHRNLNIGFDLKLEEIKNFDDYKEAVKNSFSRSSLYSKVLNFLNDLPGGKGFFCHIFFFAGL